MDRHSASRVTMNCTTLAAHQLARGEQCLLLSGCGAGKVRLAAGVKTNRSLFLICQLTLPALSTLSVSVT